MHKHSDFVGQIMYPRSHSLIYVHLFSSWLAKNVRELCCRCLPLPGWEKWVTFYLEQQSARDSVGMSRRWCRLFRTSLALLQRRGSRSAARVPRGLCVRHGSVQSCAAAWARRPIAGGEKSSARGWRLPEWKGEAPAAQEERVKMQLHVSLLNLSYKGESLRAM